MTPFTPSLSLGLTPTLTPTYLDKAREAGVAAQEEAMRSQAKVGARTREMYGDVGRCREMLGSAGGGHAVAGYGGGGQP